MKTNIRTITLSLIICSVSLGEEVRHETPHGETVKGVAVAGSTALTQALGRVDLAIAGSRVNMRHLQGAFGEHRISAYLNQGGQWTPMRQIVGRQGIDLIHLKVSPDGQIRGLMVSEVKTGNSRLARTKTGLQMTHEWTAPRLKFRANQYRLLSLDLSKGGIRLARAPSGLARKQMLEVPYGKDGSALFWRETNQSSWNLSAKPDQTAIVQRQVGRIAQWLDGVADGRIDYRRRIYRDRITNGKLITTVKDASLLDAGVPESKLPVLHRVEVPYKAGGPIGQSLTKAWAEELRRTNPMLNDREVLSQAREEARNTLARKLNFKPMSLGQSLAKGAGMSAVSGGVLAGAIDMGMQLVSTGEVDFKQVGANTLVGGAAGATGYLAGSGATYALTNTTLGLNLSRQLATSIGITTSCSANLLGSAVGGGLAAAVFSYGLYFMGYADLETANRMTVAGVAGSVAGAAVIYSLGGAAATSAAMTTIAGGSAVAGSILAATGVGLVVVGVGAGITWFFTAYDAAQETKRLELTGEYLSEHYGKLAE